MTKNKDIMLTLNQFPVVQYDIIFKETLEEMSKFNLGIACLVDKENNLKGVITDGDIRRKILNIQKPFSAFFVDDAIVHAVKEPICSNPETNINETLKIMNTNQIWGLPVINNKKLVGLVHLHPALNKLINKI